MTVTDELRRLLDERGVEHYDGTECTYWGDTVLARRDGTCPVYRFSAIEVVDGLSVHLLRVTPAQAIDATLGRGTCHAVFEVDAMSEDERIGEYVCSECGETFGDVRDQRPNYCPGCGRRVVE